MTYGSQIWPVSVLGGYASSGDSREDVDQSDGCLEWLWGLDKQVRTEEIRNILGIVSVCNLLRQGILTLVGTEGLANLIGTIGG